MKARLLILLLLCFLILLCGTAYGDYIILKNGSHRTGEIVGFDRDGFTFVFADSRKPKHLRWSRIDPQYAQKLRNELRLKALENEEEIIVEEEVATVLKLKNGGEIMGVLVDKGEDHYTMTRRGLVFTMPGSQVASVKEVYIDALKIYTKSELAKKRLAEFKPETAVDYKAYGDYCKHLEEYAEAKRAYLKAIEKNPSFRKALNPVLDILDILEQDKNIRRDYARIRLTAFSYHKYAKAEELMNDFRYKYSNKGDLIDKIEKDIEADKKKWLMQQMAYWYFRTFYSQCRRVAIYDKELKVALSNLRYVKDNVEDFVISKLNIDRSTFKKMWKKRNEDGNWVMLRMASYGTGSFLARSPNAGRPKAQKPKSIKPGRSVEGPIRVKGGPTSGGGKGRSGRRGDGSHVVKGRNGLVIVWPKGFYKNRGPGVIASKQEWWSNLSVLARTSFLKAKYAEKNLKIVRINNLPCSSCGGRGSRRYINFNKGAKKIVGNNICTVCHGLKVYKEIRFH
ncbi:tetratricopeptide repeat protein [Planctomycetota bacterium]